MKILKPPLINFRDHQAFLLCFHVTGNVLVVTRPLPRDGGMVEDHGAPEAGQHPIAWTKDCKETESCQIASGAKSL